MVLNAGRNEDQERPCVLPGTSGRWAIVSSEDVLTEMPNNHHVALLDVSGEETYPSQAEKIDQCELPVVEWELPNPLKQARGY